MNELAYIMHYSH